MAKNATLDLGSISAGTCKAEDIADALIWHMDELDLDTNDLNTFKRLKKEFAAAVENPNGLHAWKTVKALAWQDEITELAGNYTPDYCYLGMHAGDGADFGVWPDPDLFIPTAQGGFDGSVYRSTTATNSVDEHVPAEYTHYLAVNDHGNCTLWSRNGDTWTECWSIV